MQEGTVCGPLSQLEAVPSIGDECDQDAARTKLSARGLAPYIQLNTNLRTKVTSEFEKDFFKLITTQCSEKRWRTYARESKSILHELQRQTDCVD